MMRTATTLTLLTAAVTIAFTAAGCATTARGVTCDTGSAGPASVGEAGLGQRWFCRECAPMGTGCGADTVLVARCGTACRAICGEPLRAADFPRGAIPAPNGTYVRGYQRAMVAEAEQAAWLVARHEWYAAGDELGPDGTRHVEELAARIRDQSTAGVPCDHPVVIEAAEVIVERKQTLAEATADARALDASRRDVVVSSLLSLGVADADARVIVQPIDRVGLQGVEAPFLFNRGFGGFGQRGGGRNGGGFGGGGFGGGAGGGFGGF